MTKRKKRILTAAGILILIIVIIAVVAVVTGEKKIKIAADNGKEYWVSCEREKVWLESKYHHRIKIYNEKSELLADFDIKGDELQKVEIKYDGTVDDWDFYILSADTEYISEEYLWKERGDEHSGEYYIEYCMTFPAIERINELKEYALKKINEGEYEWLYSYSDVLISEGHTELIEIVKNVVEDRAYSPKYVEEDEFYRKCEELLSTYSSEV